MIDAEIPALDDDHVLRFVELDGYRLLTWDGQRTHRNGEPQWLLGYAFWTPGNGPGTSNPEASPLFSGLDFGCSPMHGIDSEDAVRGILGFLTLRPGDTDAEWFEDYSPDQMAFAEGDAESLSMWALEPEPGEPSPEFVDLLPTD